MPYRDQPPILFGLMGDSGSGKSTLAAGIQQILGAERVSNLCLDDYHRYDRAERQELGITPLHPDCNYLDLMGQHLVLLRRGETVFKPVYDHATGTFGRPELLRPRQFVLAHGLLGFCTEPLRSCFHISVFLDPQPELRIRWKVLRDTSRRGYTPEQVHQELERRRPDSERHVMPQARRADLVVRFYTPQGNGAAPASKRLGVRILLRRPLPGYPFADLLPEATPLPRPAGRQRPFLLVDENEAGEQALDIDGAIPDSLTARIEDRLWNQMQRVRHLRPERIGLYSEAGRVRHSNTLALTQLLVTYYLVQSAEALREQQGAAVAVGW